MTDPLTKRSDAEAVPAADERPTGPPTFPQIPDQRGLATRRQLRHRGWTEPTIRHRLVDRWQLLLPAVVAPHRHTVDDETMLVAAQLWAGRSAVLSGMAGLTVLGLKRDHAFETARFLVPDSRRGRRTTGAEVVRTDRAPRGTRTLGVHEVAGPSRCLVDAAVWDMATSDDRLALTVSALQQGIVGPDHLRKELLYARRNDTAGIRQGLDAYEAGAWSRPEAVLADVLGASTVLPGYLANPSISLPNGRRLPTPDAYIEEVGLAIQVHSRRFHARDEDWEGTVEGDTALSRAGIVVVGVTPSTLDRRPDAFRTDAEQAYLRLVGRPLPEVRVRRSTRRDRLHRRKSL